MQKIAKPKSWYIKLIHVAKNQLNMDDDLYRASLLTLTGKSSCKDMIIPELVQVLDHMKKAGFKAAKNKKLSPTSAHKADHEKDMLDKLRQVWIQMAHQGFLNDGSEQALTKWAANQSKRLNNGIEVSRLEWLKPGMQYTLIEQLKKWHLRLVKEKMPALYQQLIQLNQEDKLQPSQQVWFIQTVEEVNKSNTHSVLCDAYECFTSLLKSVEVEAVKK